MFPTKRLVVNIVFYMSCSIVSAQAVLEGGREVGWTHCLVAVGSLGPAPGRSVQTSIAGLEEEAKAMAENIAQADKVCGAALSPELVR